MTAENFRSSHMSNALNLDFPLATGNGTFGTFPVASATPVCDDDIGVLNVGDDEDVDVVSVELFIVVGGLDDVEIPEVYSLSSTSLTISSGIDGYEGACGGGAVLIVKEVK